MREFRRVVVGAALLALVVSACTPGGANQSPPTIPPAGSTPAASSMSTTLAGTFVFGGPPECPERPFCLAGLQETYGLMFAEFRPLDAGGPITVEALANGEIDVALLFSSDPTIPVRDFVILEDDRNLQRADNLVPVVNAELVEQDPEIADLLNSVSAALSQDALIQLNRQSTEDRTDPADIAAGFLASEGLLEGADPTLGEGVELTVGKTNFYEQDILAELYAQVLEANGFTVARQEASGTREVVFPALESGEIDILPEYAATALEYANEGAGQATSDPAETAELLRAALDDRGLTALEPAPAANQNAIVVTQATADQFELTTVSDLGKPAP